MFYSSLFLLLPVFDNMHIMTWPFPSIPLIFIAIDLPKHPGSVMRDFEWYDLFDLDVYSTFQVDHCADQVRTVELKENHFIAEIPACRE